MSYTKKLNRAALLGSTAALMASFAVSGGVVAQDAAADSDSGDVEEIVVTGSLIRNPNLTRSAPVSVLSTDEMAFQGGNTAEELLREIPGMVPSIGSQVNNGNGGFSYVDLRGLGSNRNLVLVDGNRMAPSELNGRFDTNNIPIALLERVDVLTGGASTTYGADAIAGVVNFITKKNFTGMEANASYGVTEKGDGKTKRIEVTVGADLDDGKGNAVMSIGYTDQNEVFQGDRDFSEFVYVFNGGARGGSGLGSFNTRFGNVNPTGVDGGNLGLGGVQDDRTFAAAFTPYNYAPLNVFQTPFERFNIYTAADYEISDSVEVYTKGMFTQTTVGTRIAPSGSFGDSVTVALNHGLMSDAQRNAFCAFDTDPTTGYTPTFTQAECDAAATATSAADPNYREVNTQLRRRNVEGGPRQSDYVGNYFNYSVGFRGDLNEKIGWDVSGTYGKSTQTQTQSGYWLKSRFRNSLLGCPVTTDGCVLVDFFGPTGSITEEMNAYLAGGESAITIEFDMLELKGNMSGELGYTVPWANDAVNFAVGAEYREYSGSRESDLLSQGGDLGGAGGAAPNIFGGYKVWEGVAEVNVPLVQDAEFAKQLTLEAGLRYSNYTVDDPTSPKYTSTTWKIGMNWTPVDDVSMRATFARAVRAPNIAELFAPQNTLLTNLNNDPCASVLDTGANTGNVPTGVLRDVCISQGAPAGTIGFIPVPAAGQANYTGGGNIALTPETSDSWTIGTVIQPASMPGLSVTIDYFNIKITDAINAPTPADAIDACFDPSVIAVSNPACAGIVRSPIDGGLSGDEAIVKGLPLALSNAGKLVVSGVDFTVAYSHDFENMTWTSNLGGTWTDTSRFQSINGVSFDRECVGFYSANCGAAAGSIQPEWVINWRNTVSVEAFDVSLNWRFISGATYEDFALGTGQAYDGPLEGGILPNENFNSTDAYSLFDLSVRYNMSENMQLTGTVSNLLNTPPELVGSFIGATGFNSGNTYPSTYDTLGRRFTIAAKVSF